MIFKRKKKKQNMRTLQINRIQYAISQRNLIRYNEYEKKNYSLSHLNLIAINAD